MEEQYIRSLALVVHSLKNEVSVKGDNALAFGKCIATLENILTKVTEPLNQKPEIKPEQSNK